MSRARIQRWIESGRVTINGHPVPRVSRRIASGDRLCVDMHDVRRREVPRGEAVPIDVVYEDAHLLAVNKPAGLVVHPSYKHETGTLLNGLLHRATQWASGDSPALLTRLDKMTSGLLLVAKRAEIVAALQHDMRAQRIEKDYLALVHGIPTPARGTITLALDRDPWDRRRVTVTDRGGQHAVTRYMRLAVSPPHETGDDTRRFSLVRCRLVTGRMHQLRVHLAHKGWPIVGDPTYGRADTPGRGRQALHAWRLSLVHPITREPLTLEAPLPDDMQRLLDDHHIAWPPNPQTEDAAVSGEPD
jgi:23S rRNA pseudouridine1911/1915/1917 synthase